MSKMLLREISEKQKREYNQKVTHIMQSWEWGEFRKSLGGKVLRFGLYQGNRLQKAFQITFHKIPFIPFFVGYLPKGPFPDKDLAQALVKIGKEQNCAFIKIEPDIEKSKAKSQKSKIDPRFIPSLNPLFTKYNYVLDLTKSGEELLKKMHPKTRYNIKLAQKHGVKVEEREDNKALEIYLKLYFETTKRQGYHGHDKNYHQKVWQTLHDANMARLLIAFYPMPHTLTPKPLNAWMLLNFKDTLYYPYGGSSLEHKNVMAPVLTAWEAIKLGGKMKIKKFDLWGALGPDAPENDPWQGFTRFKKGLGGELVEYLGTYDLVFNWPVYWLFTAIDKLTPLKIFLLKLVGR